MKNSSTLSLTGVLLGAVLLSACAPAGGVDRRPEISGIELTPDTMPEASRIQVPMPPEPEARTLNRAEASSLWQSGSDSFFADRRASTVGDVVTIDIEIDDQARMRNASSRSREGSASVARPEFLGYGAKLDRILPGIAEGEVPDNLVELGAGFERSGEGSIDRGENINLKLAALVIDKLPNGNLVVAGRQEVKVNDEIRELRVAGIIDPRDIAMDNSIDYAKIAEARITYGGRGQLSRQTRTAYGEEAMDIVLPY